MATERPLRRLVTADGVVVAEHVETASTLWSRFWGLMGRRALPAGHGLAITPCSSIHMFFMRFPVDVAFVAGDGTVKRVYHGLRPWRVSRIVRGARTALELPAGTLAAAGVEAGATLQLV
ncbi:MAG TPA: DUF192 domain-containing protein [Candidatus Dormibacteraeota bacterium]